MDLPSKPQVKPGVQIRQSASQSLQLPFPRLLGQSRQQIFIVVAECAHLTADHLQVLFVEPLVDDNILLGLYLPGGIDPLGQVDNHHSHQDDHCYHKQVIEPQEAGLNAKCQSEKHLHSRFQRKQKKGHLPRCGFVIQQQAKPPSKLQLVKQQGNNNTDTQVQPNCCGGMLPRLKELSVRAMENMVGIAMANPPARGMGKSCAFSPVVWTKEGMDNTIFVGDELEETIYYVTFDMDEIRAYREREDLGKYRKPKAYKKLV